MTYPEILFKIPDSPFLDLFRSKLERKFANSKLNRAYRAELSFYEKGQLVKGVLELDGKPQEMYFLNHGTEFIQLNFTNIPVYSFNEDHGIRLNAENVIDYICFFFGYVRGPHGAFIPMGNAGELIRALHIDKDREVTSVTDEEEVISYSEMPVGKEKEMITAKFVSPKVLNPGSLGPLEVDISLLFKDNLFYSRVQVERNGMVGINNEKLLLEGLPLKKENNFNPPEMQESTGDKFPFLKQLRERQAMRKSDAGTMRVLAKTLLSEALARYDGHILFTSSLNNENEKDLLKRFANMVMHTRPVVVFESHIPYLEETIAELLFDIARPFLKLDTTTGYASENALLRIPQISNDKLVCLPMHSFRGLENENRVTKDITDTDAAIFIGCNQFSTLPAVLRELTDLVITIPEINVQNFRKIFMALSGSREAVALKEDVAHWAGMLLPNDIVQALRLKLPPTETLDYMNQRVNERMKMMIPDDSPSLHELHGMGEARVMVEDLIRDIRDAREGKISWKQVDKGMLLAGPPGTGKTTLAKAIAKEADVKFVLVSASEWQDADHLGQHVAKITASFSMARRYSPCIMFIDEFDSIGSRKGGDHKNTMYQNMVVNTVLQEIQGFTEQGKVIVIGATNHVSLVDPALRRAGRLDHIVNVSYPNVEALEKIYDYYLRPYHEKGELASGVDTRAVAGLSFGLTGADVEQMVRGAARRARKADEKLNQQNLLDEVTGKPREGVPLQRITPEEMHRIAVHEAGHALLRMMSEKEREMLAYISIVPRNNGKLGFVASLPSSSVSYTRKQYIETLQVLLAGRAAEEVLFGKENLSSGAGGGEGSDLAKATRLANTLVTQYGFGQHSGLYFSETPADAQVQEAAELLNNAYHAALDKLYANKAVLQQITDILLEKQEIAGNKLYEIIKHNLQKSK